MDMIEFEEVDYDDNFVEDTDCDFQNEIHINISLESPPVLGQPSSSARVSAANQVLPLLTNVYAERSSEPGLAAEYCAALRDEAQECRTCEVCGSCMVSPTRLLHHVKNEHGLTSAMMGQCFVCRQQYVFPVSLSQHLSNFHMISRPHLTCSVCCTQLASTAELKAHLRKHSLTEACTLCFAHFASRHQLAEHMDSNHSKPFTCNSCKQSFWQATLLERHLARHEAMEYMQCQCGWQSGECPDRELATLTHLAECSASQLQLLLEQARLQDLQETQLDSLLTDYIKLQPVTTIDLQSTIFGCVNSLVASVCNKAEKWCSDKQVAQVEEDELQCQLCDKVCTMDQLLGHVKEAHPRSKVCVVCQKHFSSAKRAYTHTKRHINAASLKPLMQCAHCDKIYTSRSKLNWHLEKQHKLTVVRRPHACPECPRKFVFEVSRVKHVASQHCSGGGLKCPYCPATFIRPKFLQRHEARYHAEQGPIQCHLCRQQFDKVERLKSHMVYTHGPSANKNRFECPECPVGCRTAVGLKIHMRIHSDQRPHVCPICQKGFKRMQAMNWHKKSVHKQAHSTADRRVFCCTECNVQLSTRSAVTKHYLRIHRNLRRFICGICGSKMCQNQQLKEHLFTYHGIRAPSVLPKLRQQHTHIHVYPSFDKLPVSDPLVQFLSKLVEEEQHKAVPVPEFPCVLLPAKQSAEQDATMKKTNKNKAKSTTKSSDKSMEDDNNEIITLIYTSAEDMLNDNQSHEQQQVVQLTDSNTVCHTAEEELNETMNHMLNESAAVVSDSNTYFGILGGVLYQVLPSWPESEIVPLVETEPVAPQTPDSSSTTVEQASEQQSMEFVCCEPECGRSFTNKAKLVRHKRVHSDVKFYCDMCGKSFQEKYNLAVHMRSHTKERPYNCPVCKMKLRYQQQLLEHEQRHSGQRPYTCPVCPEMRSFLRWQDLRRHMGTHKPDTKLMCEECGKLLSRKETLEQHLMKMHNICATGRYQFECNECGLRVNTARQLKNHQEARSGSRTHLCLVCDKTFVSVHCLEIHSQGHIRKVLSSETFNTAYTYDSPENSS